MTDDDREYDDEDYPEEYEEDAGEDPRDEEARTSKAPVSRLPLPVGDVETEATMTGTVRLTRSYPMSQNKNDVVHLGIELPFPVQPGWAPEQIAAKAADMCYQVKAIIYEQLGLEFTIGENGVLYETVHRHFPGAKREDQEDEREERHPRRPPEHDRPRGRRSNGADPHPRDLDRPDHVDPDLWDDLVDNYDEWYDNRRDKRKGTYRASSPDFKRAEDGKGIWMRPFRERSSSGARGGGSRRRHDDD